jgi:hypothetical protein
MPATKKKELFHLFFFNPTKAEEVPNQTKAKKTHMASLSSLIIISPSFYVP